MRELERLRMKKELQDILRKYKGTMTQAKRDCLRLGLKPTLKNLYEYIVVAIKESEAEEARSKAEAERKIIVPDASLIADPSKYRIIRKEGEK